MWRDPLNGVCVSVAVGAAPGSITYQVQTVRWVSDASVCPCLCEALSAESLGDDRLRLRERLEEHLEARRLRRPDALGRRLLLRVGHVPIRPPGLRRRVRVVKRRVRSRGGGHAGCQIDEFGVDSNGRRGVPRGRVVRVTAKRLARAERLLAAAGALTELRGEHVVRLRRRESARGERRAASGERRGGWQGVIDKRPASGRSERGQRAGVADGSGNGSS